MDQLNELIPLLQHELAIDLPGKINMQALRERIAIHVNTLIQSDFSGLVSILYRIDVSESKLKNLLKDNPGNDAGEMIADLIIERQLQKLRSRRQHRPNTDDISSEDRW